MKPNDNWPAITLFGAMGTSIFESDKEVLQGTAISLGISTTTIAATEDEMNSRINTGIRYIESMSYEELIELGENLNELELKFEIPEEIDSPKVFSKT